MATPPSAKRRRQGMSPFEQSEIETLVVPHPTVMPHKDDPSYQLCVERAYVNQRFQATMSHIFEKYSRDFDGIGDEIDLATGEIVVNNGHIQNMHNEADVGDGTFAGQDAIDEDEDAGVLLDELTDEDDDQDQDQDQDQNQQDDDVDQQQKQQQQQQQQQSENLQYDAMRMQPTIEQNDSTDATESLEPQLRDQQQLSAQIQYHQMMMMNFGVGGGFNPYDTTQTQPMWPGLYGGAGFPYALPPQNTDMNSQHNFGVMSMVPFPWTLPGDQPVPSPNQNSSPGPPQPQPTEVQIPAPTKPVTRYNFPVQSGRSSLWATYSKYKEDGSTARLRPGFLTKRGREYRARKPHQPSKHHRNITTLDSYDGDEADGEVPTKDAGQNSKNTEPLVPATEGDAGEDSERFWGLENDAPKEEPPPLLVKRKRGRPLGSKGKKKKEGETKPPKERKKTKKQLRAEEAQRKREEKLAVTTFGQQPNDPLYEHLIGEEDEEDFEQQQFELRQQFLAAFMAENDEPDYDINDAGYHEEIENELLGREAPEPPKVAAQSPHLGTLDHILVDGKASGILPAQPQPQPQPFTHTIKLTETMPINQGNKQAAVVAAAPRNNTESQKPSKTTISRPKPSIFLDEYEAACTLSDDEAPALLPKAKRSLAPAATDYSVLQSPNRQPIEDEETITEATDCQNYPEMTRDDDVEFQESLRSTCPDSTDVPLQSSQVYEQDVAEPSVNPAPRGFAEWTGARSPDCRHVSPQSVSDIPLDPLLLESYEPAIESDVEPTSEQSVEQITGQQTTHENIETEELLPEAQTSYESVDLPNPSPEGPELTPSDIQTTSPYEPDTTKDEISESTEDIIVVPLPESEPMDQNDDVIAVLDEESTQSAAANPVLPVIEEEIQSQWSPDQRINVATFVDIPAESVGPSESDIENTSISTPEPDDVVDFAEASLFVTQDGNIDTPPHHDDDDDINLASLEDTVDDYIISQVSLTPKNLSSKKPSVTTPSISYPQSHLGKSEQAEHNSSQRMRRPLPSSPVMLRLSPIARDKPVTEQTQTYDAPQLVVKSTSPRQPSPQTPARAAAPSIAMKPSEGSDKRRTDDSDAEIELIRFTSTHHTSPLQLRTVVRISPPTQDSAINDVAYRTTLISSPHEKPAIKASRRESLAKNITPRLSDMLPRKSLSSSSAKRRSLISLSLDKDDDYLDDTDQHLRRISKMEGSRNSSTTNLWSRKSLGSTERKPQKADKSRRRRSDIKPITASYQSKKETKNTLQTQACGTDGYSCGMPFCFSCL